MYTHTRGIHVLNLVAIAADTSSRAAAATVAVAIYELQVKQLRSCTRVYCYAVALYRAAWSLEIVAGRKDEPTARGVAAIPGQSSGDTRLNLI